MGRGEAGARFLPGGLQRLPVLLAAAGWGSRTSEMLRARVCCDQRSHPAAPGQKGPYRQPHLSGDLLQCSRPSAQPQPRCTNVVVTLPCKGCCSRRVGQGSAFLNQLTHQGATWGAGDAALKGGSWEKGSCLRQSPYSRRVSLYISSLACLSCRLCPFSCSAQCMLLLLLFPLPSPSAAG